jgi:hypothetical protein
VKKFKEIQGDNLQKVTAHERGCLL